MTGHMTGKIDRVEGYTSGSDDALVRRARLRSWRPNHNNGIEAAAVSPILSQSDRVPRAHPARSPALISSSVKRRRPETQLEAIQQRARDDQQMPLLGDKRTGW